MLPDEYRSHNHNGDKKMLAELLDIKKEQIIAYLLSYSLYGC